MDMEIMMTISASIMLVHPDLVEVFGSNESLNKFFTLIKALLVMFIVIVFIWNYVVIITQEEWAFINFMQQRGSEHRRYSAPLTISLTNGLCMRIMYFLSVKHFSAKGN